MEQKTLQMMQQQIDLLKWRLRFLYFGFAASMIIMIAIFTNDASQAETQRARNESSDNASKIIRTRGIIIEDEQGRERILIGAPLPPAKNRVRTNLARVREVWAKRFPDPDKFVEKYNTFNHFGNGLVILDENGFDRIALGDPSPEPNIGRIAPSTGMVINDELGFERSGYGLMKFKDGTYRVGLGLDAHSGESLNLWVDDKNRQVESVGMRIKDHKNQSIFVGIAPPNDSITALPDPFTGLLIKEGKEMKHQINVNLQTNK